MASSELNIRQLILVPALITLGVTLLRLVGELNNWAPVLFSREAGGGGAIVGISWLPIIFGVYFALKLVKMGHGPKSGWKAAGFSLLAILAIVAVFAGASAVSSSVFVPMAAGAVGSLLALFVLSKGWAELFKTLVAYAFAARIPVLIVMLIAMFAEWGTHYEAGPPNMPAMAPFVKWIVLGVIPQMTFWIAFTALVGNLFGSIAVALTGKGAKQAAQTA
jgi:hypothetical protein